MSELIMAVQDEMASPEMKSKLFRNCRQVSIEATDDGKTESVFSFDIPVLDAPSKGAIVQVVCAGVCYRRRHSSGPNTPPQSPLIRGIRDAALFPGFEVAGIIDQLGCDVPQEMDLKVGSRVVVYPYKGLPSVDKGYAEYISVPDANCLVTLPDGVPLHIGAMLPSGALWAINAVQSLVSEIDNFVAARNHCNVLTVGTGGLALWIISIAKHYLASKMDKVKITVAALRDDALGVVEEQKKCSVVSWSEDVYESHLIERTKDACGGLVDVVLDFGATPRSLVRSIRCLREGGVVVVGTESYQSLAKKFECSLQESGVKLWEVESGSLEQLKELVRLVAEGEIRAPPCNIFPVEDASDVLRQLSQSVIKGRAVLQFNTSKCALY